MLFLIFWLSFENILNSALREMMKIFKSLNCMVCKAPFAPIANQPRSPRYLGCGEAMCHECFEREKLLEKEERKHQCFNKNCFYNPNFAYFLIDVLSQDSLTLSPMQQGYLLLKPFQLPECSICHEEYSITLEGKSSFLLHCNHIICTECYKKIRTRNVGSEMNTHKYSVKCPVCKGRTSVNVDKRKDRLQDVLAELPEMTRQLEEMSTTVYRFCEECNKMDTVDEMFDCDDCEKKVCGTCVVKKHRFHDISTRLEIEAAKMSNELRGLSTKMIEKYKDSLPKFHKDILDEIENFEKKLHLKEKSLQQKAKFEVVQRDYESCKKLTTDFETTSEEYKHALQKYGTTVQELMKTLDNDSK